MKKSVLAIMVGALCIILSSCQETPEESSVAVSYTHLGGRRGLRAFAGIKGTREDYSYRST